MKRSRKLLVVALLCVILVSSFFVYLKLDFDNRNPVRLFTSVVKSSPAGMQAFQKLDELTSADAVVFSWWDYGLAIQEFGKRKAVVAYPSGDIIETISGVRGDRIFILEMQLFGTFEPSQKTHDVARALLLPEDESLAIMRKYGGTHVMVFPGQDETGCFGDPLKFYAIAKIAGYNATEYANIDLSKGTFSFTSKSGQATMLRLMFDDEFQPQHFTKIYENKVAKIYRIDYPITSSVDASIPNFSEVLFLDRASFARRRSIRLRDPR
jgi:asparagine N-glycosylation enzyme membrane subunit Stt3